VESLCYATSSNAVMTCRNANRDLFISMPSLANVPDVYVYPTRSLPAKSRIYILPVIRSNGCSTLIVSIECDRLECVLSLCAAVLLFFDPAEK